MSLKIGYFADGPWSHKAFDRIILDDEIKIQFICVRYDTQDMKLKEYAKKHNIPYLKHPNINSEEFINEISCFNCDLLVSMSFNQIFRENIINLTPYKIINCHAGKLPSYRGRNILNWVLVNDEKEFGVTVHYVDKGVDTGDIILQKTYSIDDEDDYSTLLTRAYDYCADCLYVSLKLFKDGKANSYSQSEVSEKGLYCTRRIEGDEIIDWNQTSREIFNFVRAICKPGPSARTFLNGKEVKINKVIEIEGSPIYKGITGAVLRKDEESFLVKTKDSYIKVLEFDCDFKIKVGDRLEKL